MKDITIGSDPELFFVKNGKFISAVGKLKGTKQKPYEFQKGFHILSDNVAIEFNVPPAKGREEFVENHHIALKYCRDVAIEQGLSLKIVPDAIFDDDQLNTEEAQAFGCNPDFNAWELEENPSPDPDTNLRTAGGHLHIGCDLTDREKIMLARVLDIFVGIPLKLMEPKNRRNELYGGPGCMRFKPYGLEYRTPSNFWLKDTKRMGAVYDTVYRCVSNRNKLFHILGDLKHSLTEIASNTKEVKKLISHSVHTNDFIYSSELHSEALA